MILYEYPFNERIRTYLRLEHLFRRLAELVPRTHPLDHHFALTTMFEVMDVAAHVAPPPRGVHPRWCAACPAASASKEESP